MDEIGSLVPNDCCHVTPMLVLVYMKSPHVHPLQLGEAISNEPSAEIVTADEFPGDEYIHVIPLSVLV